MTTRGASPSCGPCSPSSGSGLVGWGLGAGLVSALILANLLTSVLYGVSPRDPPTFALVPLLLALFQQVSLVSPLANAFAIPAIGLVPDGERIWTYREAMTPKACPKSLIVIGSGAIGIEFASFYLNMGAKVTVAEMVDRILPAEDEEISTMARKSFEKQGMKIMTGAIMPTARSPLSPGNSRETRRKALRCAHRRDARSVKPDQHDERPDHQRNDWRNHSVFVHIFLPARRSSAGRSAASRRASPTSTAWTTRTPRSRTRVVAATCCGRPRALRSW